MWLLWIPVGSIAHLGLNFPVLQLIVSNCGVSRKAAVAGSFGSIPWLPLCRSHSESHIFNNCVAVVVW